jgi:hypothetical protein
MIWFFERRHLRLHYEIRRQLDGPGFELLISYPDGTQYLERYPDSDAVIARSRALQNVLLQAGWRQPRLRMRAAGGQRRAEGAGY